MAKKINQTDATLRNVRAANARFAVLRKRIADLEAVVGQLIEMFCTPQEAQGLGYRLRKEEEDK